MLSDTAVTAIIAAIPATLAALAAFVKSIQNGKDMARNAQEGKARGEATAATVAAVKANVDELHGAMVASPTVVVTPQEPPQ